MNVLVGHGKEYSCTWMYSLYCTRLYGNKYLFTVGLSDYLLLLGNFSGLNECPKPAILAYKVNHRKTEHLCSTYLIVDVPSKS